MKTKICILLIAVLSVLSCEDILDKKPLDIISDKDVWNDQTLISGYLAGCYLYMSILTSETPTPRHEGWESTEDWWGPYVIHEISDEAKVSGIFLPNEMTAMKVNGLRINGGLLEWWDSSYRVIRKLNEFIARVPDAPVDQDWGKEKVAEARFLRAYNYFSMVKRYGGVPIITQAQSIDDSKETLYPARDKEQTVYDFVLSEIDDIVNDLPKENTDSNYGKPTKYAALALKSRAALYAGSIAQFGTVQLDGVVGIPSSAASDYYQISYEASELIMQSHHRLYNADANKVTNFKNVFLKEDKDNPEAIWVVKHDYIDRDAGGNGWCWDFFQCPKPHAWDSGNQTAPYLEMAEEFEYIDGRPGKLDRNAIQQGLWTTEELWKDKDPRFFATLWTQDTPWKGTLVDYHYGIILPDGSVLTDQNSSYEGIPARGIQSPYPIFTGFGIMKYLDESKDNMGNRATSGTDWQIFRYGEILLNYAEAAFELGKQNDALNAINQIRDRAGIQDLRSVDLSRESIRHERKVELAFEAHRYWDLRRWRIAERELSINRSGLQFTLDYNTRKFQLLVVENIDGTVSPPQFHDYNYYFPITLVRTGNNPNLKENPGYH